MRSSRSLLILIPVAIAGLITVARLADVFNDDAAVRSRGAEVASRDPLETLKAAQAGKRLVNVHEHVQSLAEAERLLSVMDRFGIRKSVLMGSSWFTITLNERVGFTRYDENNEELVKIVAAYPERFEAWPTINPLDEDKLEKFKRLRERGATGLKLYLGHGFIKRGDGKFMFHTTAMDDPGMLPVYEYCEENHVPICFHVNPGPTRPGFAQEFIAVLNKYPDLKIICPHFMLSSIKDSRLRELLDTFPNLYSDISFGHDTFLIEGLERISRNPRKFQQLFRDYPGRFMWGTDLVITDHPSKDADWMSLRVQAYLDMLTREAYTTGLVSGKELRGIALEGELLERILYGNFEAFKQSRPRGTTVGGEIEWSRMGVPFMNRAPGEFSEPPTE